MLTLGERYCAFRDLPCHDSDVRIPARIELKATGKDQLTNEATGEVFRLMTFQSNRSEWFFQRTSGFNPPAVLIPTLQILTVEIVRAYPDRLMHELYDRLVDCDPRPGVRKLRIDSFSSALSQDPRIEMFKDGKKVERLEHNVRYCTFRPKGWAPAR